MANGGILLLTTTGRKTGKQRTTPVGYFREAGYYVIIGSNAGLDYLLSKLVSQPENQSPD